jgi:hydrogenase maturation protease
VSTTLVLGIGNNLLTDEGVGIHVIALLAALHPAEPGLTYVDGGTLSFTLAQPIAENDNLIVVDAARFGESPGTVCCLEGPAMDQYLAGNRQSVHEVGLTDLLDIARLSNTFPVRRALVGIEPACIEWGEAPSVAVAPAVAEAADLVLTTARRWADAERPVNNEKLAKTTDG